MKKRKQQSSQIGRRSLVTLLALVMLISVCVPGLTVRASTVDTDPTESTLSSVETTVPQETDSEETTEATEVEETTEATEVEETTEETTEATEVEETTEETTVVTEETEPAQDPETTALYNQIMSYTDIESYRAFLDTMTIAEQDALFEQFTEEQQNAIWEHVGILAEEEQSGYAAENVLTKLTNTETYVELVTTLNGLDEEEKGYLQTFTDEQNAALDDHISGLVTNAFADVTLTINQTITTDGCVHVTPSRNVPNGITYVYTWQKNGVNIERTGYDIDENEETIEFYSTDENGTWVNAALIQGTAEDSGEEASFTVQLTGVKIDALGKTYSVNNSNTKTEVSPYYAELKNGGFETPEVPMQTFVDETDDELYWKTTDSENKVEIINKAEDKTNINNIAGYDGYSFYYNSVNDNRNHDVYWHGVIETAEGDQAAEINANSAGALYQDVITIPGAEMHWQVAHMGRPMSSGTKQSDYGTVVHDTMYVVIMSTKMANEKGNANDPEINTSAEVQDVINNPNNYPGAKVVTIQYNWVWEKLDGKDENFPSGDRMYRVNADNTRTPIYTLYNGRLYQHNDAWVTYSTDGDNPTLDKYVVPANQYATRFFFVAVAGQTASKNDTIGNHVDNIWFSQDAVPLTQGNANLIIQKELDGLTEADFSAAKADLSFTVKVNGQEQTVTGDKLTWNGNVGTYTVPARFYFATVDFEVIETVTKNEKFTLKGTTVSTSDTGTTNVTTVDNTQKKASGSLGKGETETITFTNKYEPATTSVTITKEVKGNMGDWSKDFKFTVALANGTFSGSSYTVTDKDNVSKTPVSITDGAVSVDINLKHGESVKISNVPIGATLTVTESNNDGYTVTTQVTNAADGNADGSVVSFKVPDKAVTIAYTNENEVTINTGVSMDSMPYILLISVAAVGAFVLLQNKRRYTDKF